MENAGNYLMHPAAAAVTAVGLVPLVLGGLLILVTAGLFFCMRKGLRAEAGQTRIAELEQTVTRLSAENSKLALLDNKLADTVRFLSLNLPHEEVVSHVIRIIKEIVPSRFIGLYLYNRSSGTLKLSASLGEIDDFKRLYLIGSGTVGICARKKMLISKETLPSGDLNNGTTLHSSDLSAPILFNDELLGVISIAGMHEPDGHEKKVLTMITSFAGVLLRNSIDMGDARHEADTDQLTGLYNRRFFFRKASEELVRARGYAYPVSVFLFDIDDFKNYNDAYGHSEGDRLLVSLCQLVQKVTRKSSIFTRYGGEEFIVLLPNVNKGNALLYAERVRQLTESHPFPHREQLPKGFVSISGGIAEFPSHGETVEKLIELADSALYESKRSGKNRITLYSSRDQEGPV